MASSDTLRRSTRTRKAPQTFEETVYATDILHSNLKGTDTLEDFMATLFMCYKPACHEPDKWLSGRSKHRAVYKMVVAHCEPLGLSPTQMLNFAYDFCRGELDHASFKQVLATSSWSGEGIREFEQTVGLEDDEETGAGGHSDDEDEYTDAGEEEDEEDEDEEDEDGEGVDEDEEDDDEEEGEEDEDEYEASFVVPDDEVEEEGVGDMDEEEEPEAETSTD